MTEVEYGRTDSVDVSAASAQSLKPKLKKMAMFAAALQGVTMLVSLGTSAGLGAQLLADPVAELVKDDHDLTAQQNKDLHSELSHFDHKEVAFVADRGARLHVTSTDGEALDLLKRVDPATTVLDFQQMTRDTEALRQLADAVSKDPQHVKLTSDIAQLRQESMEEMRTSAAGFGGMGGFGGLGGLGGFGGMGGFGGFGGMLGGGHQAPGGSGADSLQLGGGHQAPGGSGADSLQLGGGHQGADSLQTAGSERMPGLAGLPGQSGGTCQNGGMAALLQAQMAQQQAQMQQHPNKLQELTMKMMSTSQNRYELVQKALQDKGFSELQLAPRGMSTVQELVMRSGAQTPEEKAEYRGLLMSINGDRIEAAQKAYLKQQRANLDKMPESEMKRVSEGWLAANEKNPDTVFIDLEDNLVLLPRVKYAHLDGGKVSLRVPPSSQIEEDTAGALGLHIPASGTLQVDSQAVKGVVGVTSHELGHSIMHQLRGANPEFYKGWAERLGQSFTNSKAQAQCGGAINTSYGLTNPFEYFAEGVRSYKQDPDRLKSVDPTLYQSVDEALGEARRLQASKERALGIKAAALLGAGIVSTVALGAARKDALKGLDLD